MPDLNQGERPCGFCGRPGRIGTCPHNIGEVLDSYLTIVDSLAGDDSFRGRLAVGGAASQALFEAMEWTGEAGNLLFAYAGLSREDLSVQQDRHPCMVCGSLVQEGSLTCPHEVGQILARLLVVTERMVEDNAFRDWCRDHGDGPMELLEAMEWMTRAGDRLCALAEIPIAM